MLPFPITDREFAKVDVDSFGDDGAGADGAVAGIRTTVFAMPLVEDDSMGSVNLFNRSKFNLVKD